MEKFKFYLKFMVALLTCGTTVLASAQQVHHTSSVEDDPSSSFHYIETKCEITRYDNYDDIACVMERLHMSQTSGQGTIINRTSRRDETYAKIRQMAEDEAARVEKYASTAPPVGKYRVLTKGSTFIIINSEGGRVEATYDDLPLHIPYSEPGEMCSGSFCKDEENNITALNRHAFSNTEHYKNQVVHEAAVKDGHYNVVCPMSSDRPCTVYLVNGEHTKVYLSDLPNYLPMASGNYECGKNSVGPNDTVPGPFCYQEGYLDYSDRIVGLNPNYDF
ncbi:hypothetical protein R5M92_11340 [Halomonas sp. Bachu 37]|uniref:hypothetical protein n=1 Tax=Halomonas kashgarensis TaxID=3084920 RepID=UPI0032174C7D